MRLGQRHPSLEFGDPCRRARAAQPDGRHRFHLFRLRFDPRLRQLVCRLLVQCRGVRRLLGVATRLSTRRRIESRAGGLVMALRERAIDAMAAVLDELDLATVRPEQRETVLYAHGSADTDTFTLGEVANINQAMADCDITLADVIRALVRRGFDKEAANMMVMARQRVAGDYLQTSAIVRDGKVCPPSTIPTTTGVRKPVTC